MAARPACTCRRGTGGCAPHSGHFAPHSGHFATRAGRGQGLLYPHVSIISDAPLTRRSLPVTCYFPRRLGSELQRASSGRGFQPVPGHAGRGQRPCLSDGIPPPTLLRHRLCNLLVFIWCWIILHDDDTRKLDTRPGSVQILGARPYGSRP